MEQNKATQYDPAVTDGQKERTMRDWSRYAGEAITIECSTISGPVYGFGSELGCLRIYAKMLGTGRVNYSSNLNSWYYCNL